MATTSPIRDSNPGSVLPVVDQDHFREFGYALVKQVFTGEEVAELRSGLEKVRQREILANNIQLDPRYPGLVMILGDVLSKPELREFDYVLFDDRVLSCARQVLGPDLVYFGDSSVQFGEGPRGFHKDNVDRFDISAPDWKGEYTLIRFGLYLQDHTRFSGGLKIRKKSHWMATQHRGTSVNVSTEMGDLLVWSLRTTHSGNNVLLRFAPGLSMHPRIETLVPLSWRVPEQQERLAIFGTFAAPSAHLDRYLEYMAGRQDFRPHLLRAGVGPEIEQFVASKRVEFCRPVSDFGSRFSTS